MRPRAWLLLLLLLPPLLLTLLLQSSLQPVAGQAPTPTLAWPTRITPAWDAWPVVATVTPWPTLPTWTPGPSRTPRVIVIPLPTETPHPWLVARPSPDAAEYATLWAGHAEDRP